MSLKMIKYFIYSAIVVAIVDFFTSKYAFGYDYRNYNFQIAQRFDRSSEWLYGPLDELWLKQEHYPETQLIDLVKAKDVCEAASEYTPLDLFENATDSTLYGYFLNSQFPRTPLIKCSTVPTAYLRLFKPGNNTVVIYLEPNKYEDVHFRADLVRPDFEPRSCKERLRIMYQNDTDEKSIEELYPVACREDKKLLRANHLSTFSNHDRLNLCDAAKTYLVVKSFNLPAYRTPTFQGSVVEPAQPFEVKYKTGFKNHVSIRCPTDPRMYIYYENKQSIANMHILLVHKPRGW